MTVLIGGVIGYIVTRAFAEAVTIGVGTVASSGVKILSNPLVREGMKVQLKLQ